ncbi:hypothetical protein LguiB_025688 [Lonicera macranthoides]
MASTDKPTPGAPAPDLEKKAPPPEAPAPPPEHKAPPSEAPPPHNYFVLVDVVLRILLFAAALTAVVVMVTSKQTKLAPIPFPPFRAPLPAKFNHSPAFIYFVAALSVAGLYSIITTLLSGLAILKPSCASLKLVFHFVIFDVLLLGIVAAATGTAGGVAYIGLKGNSHVGWNKVCNTYDTFCQHVAASILISLFASFLLVLLILLSVYSLSKKIPK